MIRRALKWFFRTSILPEKIDISRGSQNYTSLILDFKTLFRYFGLMSWFVDLLRVLVMCFWIEMV
jgi:hypothetical protein